MPTATCSRRCCRCCSRGSACRSRPSATQTERAGRPSSCRPACRRGSGVEAAMRTARAEEEVERGCQRGPVRLACFLPRRASNRRCVSVCRFGENWLNGRANIRVKLSAGICHIADLLDLGQRLTVVIENRRRQELAGMRRADACGHGQPSPALSGNARTAETAITEDVSKIDGPCRADSCFEPLLLIARRSWRGRRQLGRASDHAPRCE